MTALDTRLQNLQFEFGDVGASNGTSDGTSDGTAAPVLTVRTRKTGETAWVDLPATAITGYAANLLGLASGGYDYEATLSKSGQALRKAAGTFTMREPTSLAGLADAANAGAVAHTIDDASLVLPSLLPPIAANETLVFTLQDAQGNSVAHSFTAATATLDLAALNPGSYTLRAVKTRTTVSAAVPPATTPTTTVTTLVDISATVTVGPLTLADVQAGALAGSRNLTAYALDATRNETAAAPPIVSVVTTTTDHSWNLFDGNGLRTYSNENGGVWTRYFHDAQGRVTKEVRFQRSTVDAGGVRTFQATIQDFADRPTAAQLDAEYAAAVAASATTGDHIRTTTLAFDAQGNQLRQTELSAAHGAVSTRAAFDRFDNKTLEVTSAGIAGLENTMRMAYDGMNRVVMSETGPFEYFTEQGTGPGAPAPVLVTSSAVQTFGFDARGNQTKTTATDARGNTARMHYDTLGRMTRQWDAQDAGTGSTLRNDHVYDAFDRRTAMVAHDLTGRAAHALRGHHLRLDPLRPARQLHRRAEPAGQPHLRPKRQPDDRGRRTRQHRELHLRRREPRHQSHRPARQGVQSARPQHFRHAVSAEFFDEHVAESRHLGKLDAVRRSQAASPAQFSGNQAIRFVAVHARLRTHSQAELFALAAHSTLEQLAVERVDLLPAAQLLPAANRATSGNARLRSA